MPEVVEELRRQGDVVVTFLEDVVRELQTTLAPRLSDEHVYPEKDWVNLIIKILRSQEEEEEGKGAL